jgi:hypothetical protein
VTADVRAALCTTETKGPALLFVLLGEPTFINKA